MLHLYKEFYCTCTCTCKCFLQGNSILQNLKFQFANFNFPNSTMCAMRELNMYMYPMYMYCTCTRIEIHVHVTTIHVYLHVHVHVRAEYLEET